MRLLITGASGQLGAYLLDEASRRSLDLRAWSGRPGPPRSGFELTPVDLLDPTSIRTCLDRDSPDVVLHAAAISAAEEARRDPTRARAVNVEATRIIADWCEARRARLIFTSTDLVFDGTQPPYREDATTSPILEYGRTKAEAEGTVAGRGLIVRVSLLYGPTICDRPSFFDKAFDAVRRGEPQAYFEDEFRTPLDYASAARGLLGLAEHDREGIVHLAGLERVSRFDLMRRAAASLGLPEDLIRPNCRGDVALPEPRPADVSLDTSRLAVWLPGLRRPSIEAALLQG